MGTKPGRPLKDKEVRQVCSIRLQPLTKRKLIKIYGSLTIAVEKMYKELHSRELNKEELGELSYTCCHCNQPYLAKDGVMVQSIWRGHPGRPPRVTVAVCKDCSKLAVNGVLTCRRLNR